MPEFLPTLFPVFLIVLFILFSGVFTVKQQVAAIVERFGKFHSIRNAVAPGELARAPL